MSSKTLLICFLCLVNVAIVIASTEIYEYDETAELIEITNDKVEEVMLQDWGRSNIFLNYRNDFLISNKNRVLFRAKIENSETQIHKKEREKLRVFTKFQTDRWILGFGNFRPVFGLGAIYKKSKKRDYLNRITSNSATDLQGVFGSYYFDFFKLKIFHSRSDLNISTDSVGKRKIVYYESEKSCLEQSGIVTSYLSDNIEFSLLAGLFENDNELEQFNYHKKSYLLSAYSRYQFEKLIFEYESNYQFQKFSHIGQVKFSNNEFSTSWLYQSIPDHSLVWFNSGISNKYNRSTKIYSGECSFPLFNLDFSLGSELKSNHELEQWRNKSFIKMGLASTFSYRVNQELYNDYQAIKHTKYTHRFMAELFAFSSSNITCSYTANNKKDSGVASSYQIDYKAETRLGKLRINMRVIDNFKGEELIEDISENIIATFYDFSEDFLLLLNYQSKPYMNFTFNCSLIQSIYNKSVDSAKIELSFLL